MLPARARLCLHYITELQKHLTNYPSRVVAGLDRPFNECANVAGALGFLLGLVDHEHIQNLHKSFKSGNYGKAKNTVDKMHRNILRRFKTVVKTHQHKDLHDVKQDAHRVQQGHQPRQSKGNWYTYTGDHSHFYGRTVKHDIPHPVHFKPGDHYHVHKVAHNRFHVYKRGLKDKVAVDRHTVAPLLKRSRPYQAKKA